MTTITQGNIADITGMDDKTSWTFYAQEIRESDDGTGIVTTKKERKHPVEGVLTVELDPGPAVVLAPDGKRYSFIVPGSDSDLWSLIQAAIAIPPATTQEKLDAAVADYLTAHPPATPSSGRIANNFVATIGESISGFGNAGLLYHPLMGGASWDHVCVGSMGRIRHVANWSVGSSLLPAQLATQVPQVLAMNPRPGACVVQVGTGDLGLSVAFSSMKTDWLSIVNALWDGGITPIVVTCTPNDFAADYASTDKWNRYVKAYAATRNWPVLDHNAAVAGLDGHYADSSYTSDTLHMTGKGHRVAGQADLASGICDLFPANNEYFTARRTGDTTNVFSGSGLNRGLFTTNTGGVGTGLTGSGTVSIVAPAPVDNLMGNWQHISGAGGAGTYLTTGWSVGDTLVLAARLRTTGIEVGGTNFGVYLLASRNTGTWTQNGLSVSSLVCGLYTVPADMEGLLISAPFTILTSTDLLLLNMSIGTITGTGTPTLDVGELTVHNLTTGGWAA